MRNRFFIACFVLILLLLAGRSYQNYRFIESKLIGYYTGLQERTSFVSARAFRTFILQGFNEIERMAKDPEVISLTRSGKQRMALLQQGRSDLIGNVTRLDARMRIAYTYPENPQVLGKSVAYQEHNKKVLSTHQPVLGRPFMAVQGYEAMPLVQPVFRNGKFDGTVSILFKSSWLGDAFWKPLHAAGAESFIGLADSDGHIFWSTGSRGHGESPSEQLSAPEIERLRKVMTDARARGTKSYRGHLAGFSGRWLVGVVPLSMKDKQWFLLSGVPDEMLARALAEYRWNLLVAAALVLMLMLVLVLAMGSYRRQYSLAKARAKLADEFEAKLAERTSDLAAAKSELERYSQELETQIEVKTRKIKESEEMYRCMVDNVDSVIFMLMTNRFTFVNPGFLIATHTPGLDSSQWKSKHILDLVSERSRESTVAALDALDAGAAKVEVSDLEIVDARGDNRVWEGSLHRTRIGGRELTMGLFRDITEQRQLERQVLQGQKLESVGRLAGGIAHDFNNILGGIFGNLALLRQHISEDREAEVHELLGTVEVAARRAADLTKKLLVFSRRGDEERRPLMATKLIQEVASLLRTSMPARISFEVRVPEDDDLVMMVNPTEIQQVILNLCINGIEAMPEGGKLTVSADRARPGEDPDLLQLDKRDQEYIRIRVSDTGTGIDPHLLDRIFDPFFTTKEPGKGSGLGLSIAYHLVTKHGGTILLDSDWGRGSVFAVYVPAYLETVEAEAEGGAYEYPDFSKAPAVLMADDEEMIRNTAQAFFADRGLTIYTAGDGAEAIECFRSHQQDIGLVLLDLRMPRMNGVEAFAFIRKLSPGVPGVLMTGFGYDRPTEDFTDVGFSEVIAKPFTFEELSELFARYLF
ncbi:MAG: hypothetical protein B1H03_03985 [Planctomycetales bacterium 4484_113]|nr:MAG: hypothetical protein B1H03_03985 [Planctomycetales bacterium 4484_113]